MDNEKHLRKSYDGKINTNFHDNGVPKEGFHCICLSVALIYSVFKICKTIIHKYFSKSVICCKRKDDQVYP